MAKPTKGLTGQHVVPGVRVEMHSARRAWTGSCLPMTTALAAVLRDVVTPALTGSPVTWPLTDRVLVWLSPFFSVGAIEFHNDHGPALSQVIPRRELKPLDQSLVQHLAARAELLAPGVLSRLQHTSRVVERLRRR